MKLKADPQLDDLSYEDRQAFALTIRCPACGRGPGRPCYGLNGNRPGAELSGVHMTRIKAAREPYRLHLALQQSR